MLSLESPCQASPESDEKAESFPDRDLCKKKKKKSPWFLGGRRPFCACSESGRRFGLVTYFFAKSNPCGSWVVSVSIPAEVSGTRETVAGAAVSCPE